MNTGDAATREALVLLRTGLEALRIGCTPDLTGRFALFLEELVLWNGKTNLVGTSDPGEIVVRHILDSLTAYELLRGRKEPILDVGAGAGFPSIPLALVDDTLVLHAAEKRKKRALFLRNEALILNLRNLSVIEKDVREMKGPRGSPRDGYGALIARGVGELGLLCGLARGLLQEGGMIIAFKGKMSEIEREVGRLKGKAGLDKDLSLHIQKVSVPHLEEEERNIVIIHTK